MKNRLNAIFNAIPELVWMKDEHGTYLECNKMVESFFGLPLTQIIGKSDYDLIDKNFADAFRNEDLMVLSAKKPVSFEQWLKFPGDDLSRPFEIIKTPIYDSLGKLEGILGVARDISGHKKLADKLRSEIEFNQSLVEKSPVFFVSIDIDGKTNYMNKRMLEALGYESWEVKGRDYLNTFVPQEDREALSVIFGRIINRNESNIHVNKIQAKDGKIISCEWHGIPIFDGKGKNFFIGVGIDITKRLKTEREIEKYKTHLESLVEERTAALKNKTNQLEAINKELDFFLYSVSHDLRSPLRGINGWSLALQEDYGPVLDENGLKCIDRVRSETRRMEMLIDDLLKLAKITISEVNYNEVNISMLAQNVADRIVEENPTSKISIIIEPELIVKGDQNFLEILLTNLLGNSAKFTSKNEQALIEFGKIDSNERKIYYVRDNGVGFDMKYADRLFGIFQRLHKQSDFPGTGVGLAIVKRIINIHAGSLWAESIQNQGTVFYFTLNEN